MRPACCTSPAIVYLRVPGRATPDTEPFISHGRRPVNRSSNKFKPELIYEYIRI